MSEDWTVRSVTQLEELLGTPSPVVEQKIFDRVDEYAAAFLARSPICFVATSDKDGRLDVSPKGDAPGFVALEDEATLLLPERIGNKLMYGFRNILENPRIALIFVVPGTTETLRIAGTAELTRDPALLAKLSAQGKPALLATRVRVEECFFHCGKAFIRSALWKNETWPKDYRVNFGRHMAKKLGGGDDLVAAIEEGLADSYKTKLY